MRPFSVLAQNCPDGAALGEEVSRLAGVDSHDTVRVLVQADYCVSAARWTITYRCIGYMQTLRYYYYNII